MSPAREMADDAPCVEPGAASGARCAAGGWSRRMPQVAFPLAAAQEITPSRLDAQFARDVRDGLTSSPKRLHCRWFYDDEGSALFEEICGVPDYYIPAAEREILE